MTQAKPGLAPEDRFFVSLEGKLNVVRSDGLASRAELVGRSLTVRERQVLMLSNEGRSNKEIGRRLQISPATLKNYIQGILRKLKVERRGQAAARLRDQTATAG